MCESKLFAAAAAVLILAGVGGWASSTINAGQVAAAAPIGVQIDTFEAMVRANDESVLTRIFHLAITALLLCHFKAAMSGPGRPANSRHNGKWANPLPFRLRAGLQPSSIRPFRNICDRVQLDAPAE